MTNDMGHKEDRYSDEEWECHKVFETRKRAGEFDRFQQAIASAWAALSINSSALIQVRK